MLLEIAGVTVFLTAFISGWFWLQGLTREVCREEKDADVFQALSHGCGTCEREGLCTGRRTNTSCSNQ